MDIVQCLHARTLEEERNSIVKFIEDIEKDKRQTFLDAFDKVDKEIRLIFKNDWWKCLVELQNEDDIFNSHFLSYPVPNKPNENLLQLVAVKNFGCNCVCTCASKTKTISILLV